MAFEARNPGTLFAELAYGLPLDELLRVAEGWRERKPCSID
jgi:hypothetical protein